MKTRVKLDSNKFSLSEKVVVATIIVCFLMITYQNLKVGFGSFFNESTVTSGVTFFSLIIMLIFLYSLFKPKYLGASTIKITLFTFSIYFFISTINYLNINNYLDVIEILIVLLWPMCFYLGAYFAQFSFQKLDKFIKIFSLCVIFPIAILTLYYQLSTTSSLFSGNDTIFLTVSFFPFVLLLKKSNFKIVVISLFLIISFLSLKRTIIISSTFLIIIYFFLGTTFREKFKNLFSRYALIVLPLAIIAYYYVSDLVFDLVYTRFSNLSEDGGGGRDVIYEDIINIFLESSLNEMFFGHGFKSTLEYVGFLSHNDTLQILFDFGFVGLFLFLSFLFLLLKLIKTTFKNRKYFRAYFAVYTSSVISLIFITQTNCILYSPFIISPIMLLLGSLYFKLKYANKSIKFIQIN